ncbi:MAG: molybdenum cofactor biosynthesis protein [Isosphaera sp.]|nr:molybdenum cofactor biosynthesis protein [Isosphaera sp.]
MLEVADALAEVLSRTRPSAPVEVALSNRVVGSVLAEGVRAEADSPPFPKSLRDGYAVRAADCAAPNTELRVVAEVAAGAVPSRPVGPGEAVRIFTGGPIPDGADAVVMQEDAEPLDGDRVRITDPRVKPGQWVFARGTEMRAGDVVLPAGTVINPAAVGVLASVGRTDAVVCPAPWVFVLPTGNELVEPGNPRGAGQIFNSNGPMLAAQVARAGGYCGEGGIGPDAAADLRDLLRKEIDRSDVLLVAGGVSVGKFDLVPAVLDELGVAVHFRQVRMKPGKPLLFGTRGDALVFGLPGNPVSAFVCFELFVRPALRKMLGHADPGPVTVSVPLAEGVAEVNDRPTYRPAKLEPAEVGWAVRPLPWLGAPDLRGLQPADALIVLPPGEARLDRGTPVPVIPLLA